MALSLYRKYRPNVFADVVGQEHVERTLVNAITEGNVAHAYLFCGPRGTGKTTTARLLAKALLCENGGRTQPDGTCPQCTDIAQGSHPDVYELDAASRTGVENVREEIIGRVNFAPSRGRSKIYIIDEVHMLSTAAFNALLKTLEEPPDHVVFVLCTTDPQKVPETIQSRCQRFDFKRLSVAEIAGYLQRICDGEGFSYEAEALEYIAVKSNGGMRDATTALEQMAVYADGRITLEGASGLFGQMDASGMFAFSSAIGACDAGACFGQVARLVENGIDLAQFAHDLAAHFRDLYVTALTGGEGGIVACPEGELPRYQQQAQAFGAERLSRALAVCGELVAELRHSTDARLSVEVACTRLCRPESDLTLEALSERIARLERGGVVAAQPQAEAAFVQAAPVEFETQQPQPVQVQPQPQPQPQQEQGNWDDRRAQSAPEPSEPAAQQPSADARSQEPATAEPQPEPQPTIAQSTQMSPARVFQALLTEVKRTDVATGALLNGVSLVQTDTGYRLEFPDNAAFTLGLASKGNAREVIDAAFRCVVGDGPALDMRLAGDAAQAGGGMPQPQSEPAPFTGAVAPADTSASAPAVEDDGYFDALASNASYYGDAPAEDAFDAPSAVPTMNEFQNAINSAGHEQPGAEPNFDDPFAQNAKTIDDATAANLADTLSAFGSGIKFTEIDE